MPTTRKQLPKMDNASVQTKKKKFKKVPNPNRNTELRPGKQFRLLDFQSYDTKPNEEQGETYANTAFRIQMFGIDEAGSTCVMFIDDMKPFFYIQVGQNWTRREMVLFEKDVRKKMGGAASFLICMELVDHNKLYEFTGTTTFRFVKVTFKNMIGFNKVRGLWYESSRSENGEYTRTYKPFIFQNTILTLYESKIPPLLRYFHIHNISPSGWIEVYDYMTKQPNELITTCDYEFICSMKHIVALPSKEDPVPYKIACFDIEASSSHGDFPVPTKNYKRLVSQIVDTFQYHVQMGSLDPTQSNTTKLFLKKSISTAFGINGKSKDIDLVYPKEKVVKEDIKTRIEIYLKDAIMTIQKDTKNKEGKKHLKITSVFEKIADDAKSLLKTNGGGDGGDGDGDGDDTGGPVSDVVSGGFGSGVGESNRYVPRSNHTSQQTKISNTQTAVDVLSDTDYTREQKIKILNDAMTTLFPPLKGDEITFIGTTFMKYGTKEPYKNHCLVVGSCDPVANTEIVSVTTEKDCLVQWTKLIQNENPDIVIGYNIFGFDYEFMFQRSRELRCVDEFTNLSRIMGEQCYRKLSDGTVALEQTKNRLASGDYDLHYPGMSGRLQIDLLFYFRRDYNLSSYKLDDVAGTFIRDDIKGIELSVSHQKPVTRLYSKNLAGLHVDDFIHIEITSFTVDYYAKGKKFKVVAIDRDVVVDENNPNSDSSIPKGKYNVISVEGHYKDLDPKVQTLKWGMAKDDVTPQDIFRLSKESAASRAIVAKYCIQDCNLVHHLMNKTDVLTGYIEMSRICSVPISFLVFRGQGIKLTSYVAKVCREKDTFMPDLEHTQNDDGYEGAIVLPPKCAMYGENPVACNDYSSLYPSIAKGWNLSPDSKVWTKTYDLNDKLIKINDIVVTSKNKEALLKKAEQYDNLPGYDYIYTEFDNYEIVQRYTASGKPGRKDKVKSGKKVCRWAQFPTGQEGIIPNIIGDLLKARKETRVKAESEKDPFIANVLDKRQLGYKVTANSLYGQMGSSVSTFFEKDVAASITATGRQMITYAKRMVEEIYKDSVYTSSKGAEARITRTRSQYVYGDSVAYYTPVCIRVHDVVEIITIQQLATKYGNDQWTVCTEKGKETKEYCELDGVESWTEKGWTPLQRVIRHTLADHKNMVRVLTHTGVVDVTDDHSLVKSDGHEISPKDVNVGTELLHHTLPKPIQIDNTLTINEARILGMFFGDGSCGIYECTSGKKSSWAINNSCIVLLEKYQKLCSTVYSDYEWKILPTLESSGVYKLVPSSSTYGGVVEFVKHYRHMMYDDNKAKIIPSIVFASDETIRNAFFEGIYDADGDKDASQYMRIDQKNQVSAAHISWLAQTLGWNTSINTRLDKPDVYRITMTKRTQRKNPIAVKKIHKIEYTGYVYDLTTDNHHFAAGVGNLIVHNTDSVFFTFNFEDPETGKPIRGRKALELTIELAQESAYLCSLWLPPPMKLAYEKTLMSFILLSKKRYVGMLYEEDPDKGKLKFMGLPLKRRDSCDYLKDVYGGILTILMKEPDNVQKAIEFLTLSLQNLIDGKVSMEKLAITKSLRSDYKNPQQIAHKVLADRIGERDPGNKPKPGDRVKFVFINTGDKKALLGERVETPEFILQNNLQIDYTYYITNQLMNPLQQMFGLALEKIYTYKKKSQRDFVEYRQHVDRLWKESENDLEVFMKKREKYCSSHVKALLFDPFLTEIYNKQNGVQTLFQFYTKKK